MRRHGLSTDRRRDRRNSARRKRRYDAAIDKLQRFAGDLPAPESADEQQATIENLLSRYWDRFTPAERDLLRDGLHGRSSADERRIRETRERMRQEGRLP